MLAHRASERVHRRRRSRVSLNKRGDKRREREEKRMNKECPLRLPLPRCTYVDEDGLVMDQSMNFQFRFNSFAAPQTKSIPLDVKYQMGPTLSRKEGKNQLWWPKPSAGRTPPRSFATALPRLLVDKRGTGFPEHASEEEVPPWDLPEIGTFTRNWRGESSPRSPAHPPTALLSPALQLFQRI